MNNKQWIISMLYTLHDIYIYNTFCEISLKANVASDKSNGRNEMWQLDKEIYWCSWTHGLRAQLVRASKQIQCSLVEIPFRSTFCSYIKNPSVVSTMFQFIPLLTWLPVHDFAESNCGNWRRQWTKWNVNTGQRDVIGVAVQSWLWVQVELMAW